MLRPPRTPERAAFVLASVILLGGCVGPTERPQPLPATPRHDPPRLVLKETYTIGVWGAEYLLPYGSYEVEAVDERGVYYRAPIPLKKRGLFGGAFSSKESLVEGGIYFANAGLGSWIGPWLYIFTSQGGMRTTTIPGPFASGEGDRWYFEE